MLRDARCKELGAVRTGLGPMEGGTPHVYAAGTTTAAPQGRNAALPHNRASETSLSLGTDVNEGAPPSAARGRSGAKGRGPSDHAPCCCSTADWTWESSHSGFEAEGGNGRSQNTPLIPLRSLIGPRSLRVRFRKALGRAHTEARLRIGCSKAGERFLRGTAAVISATRLGQPGT